MEEVKKLERIGSHGKTTREYVLFHGDAVFVTEMNLVCLTGAATGEERIVVSVTKNYSSPGETALHYMLGKSMKLGFLMKDYCDRNGYLKSEWRFVATRVSKQISEDLTPEDLGMRGGDEIVAFARLRGDRESN